MIGGIEISIDSKEVEKKLRGTELKMKTVAKKIMTAVSREVFKEAKTNFRNNFKGGNTDHGSEKREIQKRFGGEKFKANVASGFPLKNFKNFNSRKSDFVSYNANLTYYTLWLEKGTSERTTRKGASRGAITGKPFLEEALIDVWNNGKYRPIAEAVVEKELKKYWEKK